MSTPTSLSEPAGLDTAEALDADAVGWMTTPARVSHWRPQERIYMPDDPADRVYWVRRGRVSLTSSTEDGREFLIALVREGAMFGEVAAMLGARHAEFATAVEHCTLHELARKDFEELLRRRPAVAMKVCRDVGVKLRRIEGRLVNLLYRKVDLRVRRALGDIAEWSGAGTDTSAAVLTVTHQHIANLIGASRQETSRALKRLESEGLIELRYGTIVVRSPKELGEMLDPREH